MKRQNQTALVLVNEAHERQTLPISRPESKKPVWREFFRGLFRVKPQLNLEDWERLETRRSPHSIRADARREGIF